MVVAALIAVAVIPAVRSDPLASPESAIPAFWANVLANLVVGSALASRALRPHAGRPLLVLAGLAALVLGLLLLDAAAAFVRHGPNLAATTAILAACAIGDATAGGLALAGGWLQPRRLRAGGSPS
jgi:hypothetical protein